MSSDEMLLDPLQSAVRGREDPRPSEPHMAPAREPKPAPKPALEPAPENSAAVPPEPADGNKDTEKELPFDTVAYGVGNWHLYNHEAAKAQDYFRRVVKGNVWITWGFIGSETELARLNR